MSMVFLSLSYVTEFYVVFKHFQNLENLTIAQWMAQCKQPQLVKLQLNFDMNFIFKSTGTAIKIHLLSLKNKKDIGFAWNFLQPPIQVYAPKGFDDDYCMDHTYVISQAFLCPFKE